MTKSDLRAVVELAEENFPASAKLTRDSLETKVGNTERKRHHEIAAVIFLQLMEQLGGTFVWTDGPRRGEKFANVFEALSAKMPAFTEADFGAKRDHVDKYAPMLRSGLYAARKWLLQWYEDTVYLVPQTKESSMPTVISLDPDYMLESGKTVVQMQAERDFKLADGQVVASAKRLAASTKDKSAVREKLDRIMKHARQELRDLRPERSLTDQTDED